MRCRVSSGRRLLALFASALGLLAVVAFPAWTAPAAPAPPRPSPTHKVCHLCGEDVPPGTSTPQPGSEAPLQDGVVHAVLFWMEGCGHCEYVRANTLPPLQAEYGPAFDLLQVELVTRADVDLLYVIGRRLGVEHTGVPFLLIGEHVLIGSKQIPDELPGLVETYLQAGGVPAPVIPELGQFSSMLPPAAPAAPGLAGLPGTPAPSLAAPVTARPAELPAPAVPLSGAANGFGLATAVLVLMLAALVFGLAAFFITIPWPSWPWLDWFFPALVLGGMGVAGYLAYVETQEVSAVCGPLGDCNAVQSSPYARLWGVLPIGVLGLIGYAALLAAWLARRCLPPVQRPAAAGAAGMAGFGVLFSIYLTYLELYVIKAVCLWCLASAVIMTLLFLLSLPPAARRPGAAGRKN